MNKDSGLGLALIGTMAVCCAVPLLVALALPLLAASTGQAAFVAVALVLAGVLGVVAWRRRCAASAARKEGSG